MGDALQRKREKKKNYKKELEELKEATGTGDKSRLQLTVLKKDLEKADNSLRKMKSIKGLNRVMK